MKWILNLNKSNSNLNNIKTVPGMLGVNIEVEGKNFNHEHFCEIKLLGNLYNLSKKEIVKWCPYHIKYKQMNSYCNSCDNCIHNRRFDLDDSGNHITNLKDRRE